jgi:hypothetical protein
MRGGAEASRVPRPKEEWRVWLDGLWKEEEKEKGRRLRERVLGRKEGATKKKTDEAMLVR